MRAEERGPVRLSRRGAAGRRSTERPATEDDCRTRYSLTREGKLCG